MDTSSSQVSVVRRRSEGVNRAIGIATAFVVLALVGCGSTQTETVTVDKSKQVSPTACITSTLAGEVGGREACGEQALRMCENREIEQPSQDDTQAQFAKSRAMKVCSEVFPDHFSDPYAPQTNGNGDAASPITGDPACQTADEMSHGYCMQKYGGWDGGSGGTP